MRKVVRKIRAYERVRAITEDEAKELAKKLFDDRIFNLRKESARLKKIDKEKSLELRKKSDSILQSIAKTYNGFVHDRRGLNFVAKDRPGYVYCFIWKYSEIWIYDGLGCPYTTRNLQKVAWR